MIIKGLQDEVFGDYKKPAMYIAMPNCSFKCDKENGCKLCQNSALAQEPNIFYPMLELVERYLNNPITSAIVIAGLEPFDSIDDVSNFIFVLREIRHCDDDVVIYTGYTEEEIMKKYPHIYNRMVNYGNIIIKFGRFRPGQEPHYDEVLGVKLASDNQYAKRVNNERI